MAVLHQGMAEDQQEIEDKQRDAYWEKPAAREIEKDQRQGAQREKRREPVSQFYFFRMNRADTRPSLPEVENLFEELEKIRATFVKDKGVRDKADAELRFLHPDTKLDVFGKAIKKEALTYVEITERAVMMTVL